MPRMMSLMPSLQPKAEIAIYLSVTIALTALAALLGVFDHTTIDGGWAAPLLACCLLLIVSLCISFSRRTRLYHTENWARQLAEAEMHKLSLVVEQNPAAVAILDTEGRIEYVNPKFCTASGYPSGELLGRHFKDLLHYSVGREVSRDILIAAHKGVLWQGELIYQRKQGGQFHASATINPITGSGGQTTQLVALLEDISDLVAYKERLFQQANFDKLTSLPNRELALDRLAQAINAAERHQRPLTVLFVDLDRFKLVNDSLGHQFGDALLREAAQRLLRCVRDEDTVARLGSDEFLVLLVNQRHASDSSLVASKILDAIAQPFEIGERELNISASIGLTVFPEDGLTPAHLLRNAEAATHLAKQQGQNAYHFFTAEMNARSLERLNIETQLRHALRRNELELLYQPLIELSTGHVVGAETLIRWRNADLHHPSPTKFIPIAEETGLIVSIGQWALREACRQALEWQQEGFPPLRIAVNISSRQFAGGTIVPVVEQALLASGLPAHLLELEITEGLLLNDDPETLRILQRLKKLGVRLSLDDFGTGFSSLSYLRRYHFDLLKIDRSFISDLERKPEAAGLVKTIIALAHNLGLEVIGEGVETPLQAEFIRKRNCHFAQGYLFSKPLPALEFGRWLQARRSGAPQKLERR